MSKDQLKDEINQVLDHFSPDALEELLQYLRQLDMQRHSAFYNADELHRILEEDAGLLRKLAQ